MKVEFSGQIFGKYSDIKFNENPSSGSRVVPCGRRDGRTDRQTDRELALKFCVHKYAFITREVHKVSSLSTVVKQRANICSYLLCPCNDTVCGAVDIPRQTAATG
jgi:hypothetical protein